MKKHVALILTVLMMVSLLPFSAFAADKIAVTLDNETVTFPDNAQPFVNKEDRTMVPLSPIAKAMDLKVDWNNEAQTATFTKTYTAENTALRDTADKTHTGDYYLANEVLTFTIGSKTADYKTIWYDTTDKEMKSPIESKAFSKTVAMDTSAVLLNQRTYAPVKYLAETFGCEVNWDEKTNTVVLYSTNASGASSWELLGNAPEYTAFGIFKGRLYEQMEQPADPNRVTKLEVVSAKLDGKAAAIKVFGKEEMDVLSAESGESNCLSGFYLNEKLESGKTYSIMVTLRYTYANGTDFTSEAELTYTAEDGYGGIL